MYVCIHCISKIYKRGLWHKKYRKSLFPSLKSVSWDAFHGLLVWARCTLIIINGSQPSLLFKNMKWMTKISAALLDTRAQRLWKRTPLGILTRHVIQWDLISIDMENRLKLSSLYLSQQTLHTPRLPAVYQAVSVAQLLGVRSQESFIYNNRQHSIKQWRRYINDTDNLERECDTWILQRQDNLNWS